MVLKALILVDMLLLTKILLYKYVFIGEHPFVLTGFFVEVYPPSLKDCADEAVNQLTNKSTNQQTRQSTIQPIDQPTIHPINQPINQQPNQSTN